MGSKDGGWGGGGGGGVRLKEGRGGEGGTREIEGGKEGRVRPKEELEENKRD